MIMVCGSQMLYDQAAGASFCYLRNRPQNKQVAKQQEMCYISNRATKNIYEGKIKFILCWVIKMANLNNQPKNIKMPTVYLAQSNEKS